MFSEYACVRVHFAVLRNSLLLFITPHRRQNPVYLVGGLHSTGSVNVWSLTKPEPLLDEGTR